MDNTTAQGSRDRRGGSESHRPHGYIKCASWSQSDCRQTSYEGKKDGQMGYIGFAFEYPRGRRPVSGGFGEVGLSAE